MGNKTSFKTNRNLLSKKGNRVSILQIIGFIIMMGGLIYLVYGLIRDKVDPEAVAISFFIIMLGFAFAFPTLLRGNEGLSTMRIVVFMVTNVICMLLLKIGWVEGMTLEKIGLDEYWMGVIAFVFGGKATQAYFESKLAVPKEMAELKAFRQQRTDTLSERKNKLETEIFDNKLLLNLITPGVTTASDTQIKTTEEKIAALQKELADVNSELTSITSNYNA